MGKNSTTFEGSDELALDYIRKRGYASYSSLSNVRDKKEPTIVQTQYYDYGTELHSRFLEKKKIKTLSKEEEAMLKAHMLNLNNNIIVSKLMASAKTEDKFDQVLWGLRVLGYIDINSFDIGDLKTTRHSNRQSFAANMDFLQAALYLTVTKKKHFYYIGVSKVKPYNILIFNVHEYPDRLQKSMQELNYLIRYVKSKL